ncbi:MAG: MFS transporter [Magnetovibrio sp.]|nr:MFS transporter [Magnetovibrio sp.]
MDGNPAPAATRPGRLTAGLERLTGVGIKDQLTAYLVGVGHGGTHWLMGTVYILLPFARTDLGLSYAEIGAVITAMNIAAFGVNIVSGAVVDITGRRVLLLAAGLALCAVALLCVGLVPTLLGLTAGVMLLGGANNLWHPAAFSFLSRRFPENRGFALSVHGMGANLGDALGPLAAGAMMVWIGWQGAAVANALPAFVLAGAIWLALPKRAASERAAHADAAGLDLASYFRGMLSMVKNRAVLGLCVMAGFRTMTQNGLLIFLPMYLADVIGFEAVVLGLVMAGMQTGGIISGPIAGTWSDRIGRRPIVLGGMTASTIVIVALTVIQNEAAFVAGVALLGFVLYAVRPVVHSWMMDLTPPEVSGSATSLMFGTQGVFKMGLPVLGGFIADTWGLAAVFYLLAATMLSANLVAGLLPGRRPAG